MIREDRELLAGLASLNKQLVTFACGVMDDKPTPDEQLAVACRLVDLAEAIQARAQRENAGVVEAEIMEVGDTSGNPASQREP